MRLVFYFLLIYDLFNNWIYLYIFVKLFHCTGMVYKIKLISIINVLTKIYLIFILIKKTNYKVRINIDMVRVKGLEPL